MTRERAPLAFDGARPSTELRARAARSREPTGEEAQPLGPRHGARRRVQERREILDEPAASEHARRAHAPGVEQHEPLALALALARDHDVLEIEVAVHE